MNIRKIENQIEYLNTLNRSLRRKIKNYNHVLNINKIYIDRYEKVLKTNTVNITPNALMKYINLVAAFNTNDILLKTAIYKIKKELLKTATFILNRYELDNIKVDKEREYKILNVTLNSRHFIIKYKNVVLNIKNYTIINVTKSI